MERAEVNLVTYTGLVIFRGKNYEALILNAINKSGYKAVLLDAKLIAKRDVPLSRTILLRIYSIYYPQYPKRVSETTRGL